jgi:hypothetical protein
MDLEEKDYEIYTKKIDQIDDLIVEPIRSLLKLVGAGLRSPKGEKTLRGLEIPTWVSEELKTVQASPLTRALCCSTLQRLWRLRRRFPQPQLEKDFDDLAKAWQEGRKDAEMLDLFCEPFVLSSGSFNPRDFAFVMAGREDGAPHPHAASQVFWVLLNAGERKAHSALGFYAFFCMLWSLRSWVPEDRKSSLGLSPPTAYIAARCLAPLFTLYGIARRRAELLRILKGLIERAAKEMRGSSDAIKRRRLPFLLEELSSVLHEFSEVAINHEGFRICAETIGEEAAAVGRSTDTSETWARCVVALLKALKQIGTVGSEVLQDAGWVVNKLLPRIVNALGAEKAELLKEELGVDLNPPDFVDGAGSRYWQDHKAAAAEAREVCSVALRTLKRVTNACLRLSLPKAEELRNPKALSKATESILKTLDRLAEGNEEVAQDVQGSLEPVVQWCERVLTREIASASARNLTEFDPAELVSALYVVARVRPTYSPLQLGDALEKLLVGVRPDGSWIAGQPFLMRGNLGLWAPTSDIVWMLASTIAMKPGVNLADEKLMVYVDWLERTDLRLNVQVEHGDGTTRRVPITGWVSERALRPRRVDVWATIFAVNALLGVRDLMEFRLWELCERRFTVLREGRRLSQVEAVDLSAVHRFRLHRLLAGMARDTDGDGYKKAEYSMILHGPPGSSKTAIAQALSMEMWRSARTREKRSPRLIRVTPADFTRKGESRLDSEARIIFDLLMRVRGATILFDEIDDLLRLRQDNGDATFFKLVVPAMLNRLQDLRDACPRQEVCFLLATNYVDRIEPALLRKGRIDRAVPLVYPDRESRRGTLDRHLDALRKEKRPPWAWAAKALEEIVGGRQLRDTDYWPWKTFESLCQDSVEDLRRLCEQKPRLSRKAFDERAASRILERLRQGRATVNIAIYKDRERLRISAELWEEFLQYHLSSADDLEELGSILLRNVTHEFEDSELSVAERLRHRLGAEGMEKLRDIALAREWPATILG